MTSIDQIKPKFKIAVLSPHLDDAMFSCAEHSMHWINQGNNVKIFNFFSSFSTQAIPEYSLQMIKNSGYDTLAKFSQVRLDEDMAAMKEIGISFHNYDLVDGGFRSVKKHVIYNTSEQLFSGRVSMHDCDTQDTIKKIISKLSSQYDIFLCPIGIGSHVDHLLVKLASESQLHKSQLFYYFEQPYSNNIENWKISNLLHLISHHPSLKLASKQKFQVISHYQSQLKLFRSPSFFEVVTQNYGKKI